MRDLTQDLETSLFEFIAEQSLPPHERYVVEKRLVCGDSVFKYIVLGSVGSRTAVISTEELPSEPFVVMRALTSGDGLGQRYQAISIPELERLTEELYRQMWLTQ